MENNFAGILYPRGEKIVFPTIDQFFFQFVKLLSQYQL
jgi:hypothetical protein